MDEEILTVPGKDGAAEPALPEAQPGAQAPAEPQVPAPGQVEPGDNSPQGPSPQRKASDFSLNRKFKRIESTLSDLAAKQEELISSLRAEREKKPDGDGGGRFDPAKFFENPEAELSQRERRLIAEIEKVRQEVQGWKQEQSRGESDRKRQEALELLFPKSSSDSEESLEDRVSSDPERTERILEILKEPGVIQLFESNRDRAVRFVLSEAGLSAKKPTVLDKKLMGGVVRGSPAGGKRAMSEEDLRSQLRKLLDEQDANPTLRGDENFQKRKMAIMSDLKHMMTQPA